MNLEWRLTFLELMAHLHKRGWRRTFVMRGNRLRAPGMLPSGYRSHNAGNDNRRDT